MTLFIISLISAYIFGSVNFSIIVFYLVKGSDIREQGSRNPGTSNVYRLLGVRWALLVLLLDLFRGLLVAWLNLSFFNKSWQPMIGLFGIVFGNFYPIS